MSIKRGDTLIEVALAIGIFSMVAITIVAVITASTSGAQSSLEVTITREEMDAQAEALRFIHESYVSGSQSATTTENFYSELWQKLTERAVTEDDAAIAYNPTVCSELYDGSGGLTNAAGANPFIINSRQLGDASVSNLSNIVVDSRIFYEPTTYPRLVYGSWASGNAESLANENLYYQTSNAAKIMQRAEGIYVVAVKDPGSSIISGEAGTSSTKPAYYDFYIRSCWIPPGSDRASTISTTIRLYDPAAIDYGNGQAKKSIAISYQRNDETGTVRTRYVEAGQSTTILSGTTYTRANYELISWNTAPDGSGQTYNFGQTYTAPAEIDTSNSLVLYAQWRYVGSDDSTTSISYIQDYSMYSCITQAQNNNVQVVDRRDGQNYTVRYINNQCWMTQDLRFSGTSLTPDSSNVRSVRNIAWGNLGVKYEEWNNRIETDLPPSCASDHDWEYVDWDFDGIRDAYVFFNIWG